MMWSIFLSSLGLVFVLEGVLPFLSPHSWRQVMQQMVMHNNRTLRIIGLSSMLIGLVLVTIARDLY